MESTNSIRNTGLITIAGALIGIVVSIARMIEVSLPAAGAVSVEEILTVIAFVTLFFGVACLARSGAAGNGSAAKIGFGTVIVGLILAAFYEIALIFQSEPSEVPGILSGLQVGVGMLAVGIAVLQAKRWQGWRRFTPILIGLYPLLMVFTYPLLESSPSLAGGAGQALDQGLTAIWFFFWLPLGLALWVETGQEQAEQPELA
jgi:hypothetical protein